jgi:AraC-like DNA-binding protein
MQSTRQPAGQQRRERAFLKRACVPPEKFGQGRCEPTTKNALVFRGWQHMHSIKRWTSRTREMSGAIPTTRRVRDLLIQDSPALRGLLRIKGGYAARALPWDGLVEVARAAAPSTVLIVAPFDDPALPVPNPRLRELIGASGGIVPVLALVPFRSACTAAVRTLLEQGVTDIADVDLEAVPDAIRPRLQAVHAQPLKRSVEPALSRFASVNTRTLVRAAAEVAVDGGTAVDLADVFRSTERTVSGWCAREALPPPRRLLAWLRLILAISLLESPHRSVAKAARGAGYSFDHSLRRAVRDMLGGDAPPRERTVSQALDAFASELRSLREQRRQEKRAA